MSSRSSSTSECSIHDEDTRFFCFTCNRRICDECIGGDCRNHNFGKARNLIEERRTSTSLKLKQFQKDSYPIFAKDIEKMAAESELIQEEIDNVKKRVEHLKETVDKIASEIVQELNCSKQEIDNVLQSEKEAVKEIEAFVDKSLSSVSSLEETEIDCIEKRLQELQSRQTKSREQAGIPKFVPSPSKDIFTALKPLFGEINYEIYEKIEEPVQPDDEGEYLVPVSPAPEIPPKTIVTSISSLSLKFSPEFLAVANECLFMASGMEIYEVKSNDKIAQIKADISFEINGFIVKSSKEILISSMQKTGIFKLQQKQRLPLIPKDRHLTSFLFVDPFPYQPTCMSLCQSEKEILVALQSNAQQAVSVHLQKYPLYEDKEFKFENIPISTNLSFTKITGVLESARGYFCLINETTVCTSHVVCVDSTGEPRFRYPADDKLKRYFVGICMLKSGIIVLADSCVMSGIHLIDEDGKLILMKRMNSKPTCLATDGRFIWIGCNNNKVEKLSVSSLNAHSNLT
ncbi:uncharacterized protein LOC133196970 [Saccostrea echinata]|uniref:uncharacterized protein LOC133196970 n=1 Tax=Saccostrea echinata TaxID=191078 RepID=UPI002A801F90|nr:uncharacterized protein LOC133196970 [Saccostrea echinata]